MKNSLFLALLASMTVAAADLDWSRRVNFDIQAQPLSSALLQFSTQTGVEFSVATDAVEGKEAMALMGMYATDEALTRLLAGTGLEYEAAGNGTVAIRKASASSSGALRASDASAMRLAQAETAGENKETAANDAQSTGDQSAGLGPELEEIVVTGTHIRGTSSVATPMIVIDREAIERGGFQTLESVVESLPQNFADIAPDTQRFQEGSFLGSQNTDWASSPNLRGLGAESTLTLVNGIRRARSSDGRVFDLSVIPLAAIERIEVVTGGRSAIYGADAVAGVVNVITRRQFDGLQTEASYGSAEDGGGRLQLSQLGGITGERASLVAAYDYQREHALNIVETDAFAPSTIGSIAIRLDGQPETERHSGFLSGRFALSDRIDLHADALYTNKDLHTQQSQIIAGPPFEAQTPTVVDDRNSSEVYGVAAGAQIDLRAKWSMALSGSSSAVDSNARSRARNDFGIFGVSEFESRTVTRSGIDSVSAVLDGPLATMGGITPRLAVGVEHRGEDYESDRFGILNVTSRSFDEKRTVRSAFTELQVPVLAESTRSLELSLAARYDDYSDFGDTFNPQAGIVWQPMEGLTLRGAFSDAFRAPALADLTDIGSGFLIDVTDPLSSSGTVILLEINGNNPSLQPEEAQTWSVGLDYRLPFAPATTLSLSYFNVDYEGRIDLPAKGADDFLVLERESNFSNLINRNPTQADLDAIRADLTQPINNFSSAPWDPANQDALLTDVPDVVIFDNRLANIALESASGLDLNLTTRFEAGLGRIDLGLNAAYMLDHEAKITPTSPAVDRLNEVGKPVDLRLRADAGWTRGAWGTFLHVNYTDSYTDPLTTPAAGMSSWTTLDVTLRFDGAQLGKRAALTGFSASLSAENLLGRDPPRLRSNDAFYGYDPTNANPLGRFISLHLIQRW